MPDSSGNSVTTGRTMGWIPMTWLGSSRISVLFPSQWIRNGQWLLRDRTMVPLSVSTVIMARVAETFPLRYILR